MSKPMKVAVLSSASGGGAGIAARRITDALNQRDDVHADFIDIESLGGRLPDDSAIPGNLNNRKITDTHFTVEHAGYVRGWLISLLEQYDVINVHWASYLIGLAELDELSRRGKPMLFTLHDYYYTTGGCHYPAGCERNAMGCVGCPQVDTAKCSPGTISSNLKIKQRIFSRPNVHLAAPSAFLVREAMKVGIVPASRAHVLRNAYEPVPDMVSERGQSTRIVLIADSLAERRKGMPLAIDALADANTRLLGQGASSFVVDIVGKSNPDLERKLSDAKLQHILHGKVTDHRALAKIFASSKFLLTCSYEDNWPNVLVEAGSYGCVPIVGPNHGCEEFVCRYVGVVSRDYTQREFGRCIQEAFSQTFEYDVVNRVREDHSYANASEAYMAAFGMLKISRFHDQDVTSANA